MAIASAAPELKIRFLYSTTHAGYLLIMPNGMRFLAPGEYQIRLEQMYQQLKELLMTLLPHAEVEHIGSSAIKGAHSKGDLDVLVRVTKEQFKHSLELIASLGFSIKSGTLRTEALCMLEGSGETAIQLIEKGSKFEMFIQFRDKMNAQPDLVERYNQLKLSCAGLSAEEYRARKAAFIESVLSEQ